MAKKLCKSLKDKKLFGVCGGIAEYFNIDATIVRIIAVLLCLFSVGTCVIVYLVIALIMPEAERFSNNNDDIDNMKRANVDPEEKAGSGKSRSDEDFDKHFKN